MKNSKSMINICKQPASSVYLICIFFLTFVFYGEATSDNPLLTFDKLYADGINAYLENNWAGCISYLELALNDWEWWNHVIVSCRKQCHEEINEDGIFPKNEDFELDSTFENLVRKTLCLDQCKQLHFGSRKNHLATDDIPADFETKKPYEYLHICYYKHGFIEKAANAVVTFRTYYPDHEIMLGNLKFYIKQGGLRIEDLHSMEMKAFERDFLTGLEAYNEERHSDAVKSFHKCLEGFWHNWWHCRFACEKPFDHGWLPDFVAAVANHYTYTLKCKILCGDKLASFLGDQTGKEFVTALYHYLQISYHKIGNVKRASQASASALYIMPNDEDQMNNKNFLMTDPAFKDEYFTPDPILVKFVDRSNLEQEMLSFIEGNFEALNAQSTHDDQQSTDNLKLFKTNQEVKTKKSNSPLDDRVLASREDL